MHSLSQRGFGDLDRRAAAVVRDAVDEAGVDRLVYLSGLVPDVDDAALSAHLASRLEVERILLASTARTLSLRAGVVIGAGSTSFEIIRQMASSLLVQPVPSWLTTRVQPIGIGDVVGLLARALEQPEPVGVQDIGGPDVVAYPELLSMVAEEAHLLRVRLPAPSVPVPLVALAAPLFCAAPARTVASLVASLRHDMVCDRARTWTPDGPGLACREAVRAALAETGDAGLAALPPSARRPRLDLVGPAGRTAHRSAPADAVRGPLRGPHVRAADPRRARAASRPRAYAGGPGLISAQHPGSAILVQS